MLGYLYWKRIIFKRIFIYFFFSFFSVSIINSPSVNITKTEVEVINISMDEPITYENFRKSIFTQEVISMVLTTREMSAEDDVRGQVIGAKITKKIKEIHFPYCDKGIALISVTVCWGENKVYVLSLDSQHCQLVFIFNVNREHFFLFYCISSFANSIF